MNTQSISIGNLASTAPREALKTCGHCKQDKPISLFYRKGGRISYVCKECHKSHAYKTRGKA